MLVKGTVGSATLGPVRRGVHRGGATAPPAPPTGPSRSVALALVLTWFLDPVDLSGEGAVLNAAVFAAALLLAPGADRRERPRRVRRRAPRALERERADVERSGLQSATQERLRITRELHDVLGHAMSVMVVQAGAAGRLLDTDDPARARAAVAEIERTGRGR